ncbi:MAG: glucosaminidase domain-containing protein [Bacteroidota bacterium]
MTKTMMIAYVKKYWFKAAILGFLLFVLFKKDISFGINFNSPERIEETPPPSSPQQTTQRKSEREYFTEDVEEAQQQSSLMDRFANFPFLGGGSKASSAEDAAVVNEYIRTYMNVARSESQQFGIPASVILASAMVHSDLGKAELSKNSKNYFQLPCTADWQGTIAWENNTCYRVYDDAATSFRDHSLFMTMGDHSKLKELGKTDYKAWAKAIERTAYSKEKKLAKQIIRLIKTYRLQQLDAN